MDGDEEEEPELDEEGVVELEPVEEVPELDEEGDVELELGADSEAEAVVVETVATAIVRFFVAVFFATCVVFPATVAVERALVVVGVADLTTFVLPVAISAVSSARPAVAAAAVQRVRRVRRRMPAARARLCRVCSSFMGTMEPSGSGSTLAGSYESPVSRSRHAAGVLATLFRPRYAQP